MEKKINLVEILKDCPKGMELDCTMYDDVRFICVTECKTFPIIIERADSGRITLTQYGECTSMNTAKCVIFPKGKTTWEGFVPPCQFKDGDVIWVNDDGYTYIAVFNSIERSKINVYCGLLKNKFYPCKFYFDETEINSIRLATEEEKQKLFDAIEENGYKWNAETKTLEKLIEPKFKVGDKIKSKTLKLGINIITKVCRDYYELDDGCTLALNCQDEWELVPNKFDISTLKPFESRVLMRSSNAREWVATFFSHYSDNKFYGCGMCCDQCIPYEKNKHLLGTTADCDEYYKTWE